MNITVQMVRYKGFEFVEGDVVDGKPLNHYGLVNITLMNGMRYHIVNSFAPRPNTGSLPCDGELLVDVTLKSGTKSYRPEKAGDYTWAFDDVDGDIATWTPSLQNWTNEMNDKQDMNTVEDTQEWKNGDSLFYPNHKMVIFIGMDGDYPVVRTWNRQAERFEFYVECEYQLSAEMPETQQQRDDPYAPKIGESFEIYISGEWVEVKSLGNIVFEGKDHYGIDYLMKGELYNSYDRPIRACQQNRKGN